MGKGESSESKNEKLKLECKKTGWLYTFFRSGNTLKPVAAIADVGYRVAVRLQQVFYFGDVYIKRIVGYIFTLPYLPLYFLLV